MSSQDQEGIIRKKGGRRKRGMKGERDGRKGE